MCSYVALPSTVYTRITNVVHKLEYSLSYSFCVVLCDENENDEFSYILKL